MHIEALEDLTIGPLLKTNKNPKIFKLRKTFTAYPISVSKVNQVLSFIVTIIGFMLFTKEVFFAFGIGDIFTDNILVTNTMILLGTVFIGIYLLFMCKNRLADILKKENKSIFIKRGFQPIEQEEKTKK
ncbi:MAG: hypothetical protein KAQ68_03635 [Clostridiales bacterium]|nr:hypothetical protein [Clostridiales bacterium]